MEKKELEQSFDSFNNSYDSLEDEIKDLRNQQEQLKKERADFVDKNRSHIKKYLMPKPMAIYSLTNLTSFEYLFTKLTEKASDFIKDRFISNFKDDYPEHAEAMDKKFKYYSPSRGDMFEEFLLEIGMSEETDDYYLGRLGRLCCRSIKYVRTQTTSPVRKKVNGQHDHRDLWTWGSYPTSKCQLLDENFNVLETRRFEKMEVPINWIGERVYKTTPKDEKKTNVYLMFNNRDRLYKIGRSVKPKAREKTLQSSDPQLDMLFYYPATNHDESHLHKMFKDKRDRGEWFDLSAKDIQKMKSYLEEVKTGEPTLII